VHGGVSTCMIATMRQRLDFLFRLVVVRDLIANSTILVHDVLGNVVSIRAVKIISIESLFSINCFQPSN